MEKGVINAQPCLIAWKATTTTVPFQEEALLNASGQDTHWNYFVGGLHTSTTSRSRFFLLFSIAKTGPGTDFGAASDDDSSTSYSDESRY